MGSVAIVESATTGASEFTGALSGSSLPQLIKTVDATRAKPAIAGRWVRMMETSFRNGGFRDSTLPLLANPQTPVGQPQREPGSMA